MDSHPQVANAGRDVHNINVSIGDLTVVEFVLDPAQMANDHSVPMPDGEPPLTGGVCPFKAPSRPEL